MESRPVVTPRGNWTVVTNGPLVAVIDEQQRLRLAASDPLALATHLAQSLAGHEPPKLSKTTSDQLRRLAHGVLSGGNPLTGAVGEIDARKQP